MTLTSDLFAAGGMSWSKITASTTAVADKGYLISASGDITLTLPANPSEGDKVGVVDASGKATTYTLTIARNGSNIQGKAEDMIIDTNRSGSLLVYVDATDGWVITTEISVGNSTNSTYIGWSVENDVTTDQTLTTDDDGELFRFTSSTTADRTLTLPSVGSSNDKMIVWVQNDSSHVITVTPNDTSQVWKAGSGYGVELAEKSIICLRYDHGRTTWDIINKSGGLVRLEGLKLYLTCDFMSNYRSNNTYGVLCDTAKKHNFWCGGTVTIIFTNQGKFGEAAAQFGASSSAYAYSPDSPDWDMFASTTGDYTVAGWVRFDNSASATEVIFSHFQGSNDYWVIERNSSGNLECDLYSSGVAQVNASGGSMSATTWYHVAVVKINGVVGLYIDGAQVAYDGSFSATNLAGSFYIGQLGNSNGYLTGRLDDLLVTASNPYDASPNSSNNDALSDWNEVFQGVM